MPAQYFCRVCNQQFANQSAAQCHRVGTRCLTEAQLRARGWQQPTGRAWHLPTFVNGKAPR